MKITYLDNSATTAVCQAAAEKASYMMTVCYGNPSSLHRLGFEAERELEAAKQAVADLIGAPKDRIFFTSGGTEANNLAIIGAAHTLQRRGKHIVTTAVEHSSVTAACDQLEKEGFEITRLMPDENGTITAAAIAAACKADTVVVSVMLVNNETGARFAPDKAIPLIRKKAPLAFIHCDAVQAAGKLPIAAVRWQVDAITVSAHKLHAPKGCGALYLRKGARVLPRQFGGKQQDGIRPGTEAAPLIAAFGEAIKHLPPLTEQAAHFETLQHILLERLSALQGVNVHRFKDGVPYITHLSVPGLRSETILHFLSQENIFVSSGSACSKGAPSPVLAAFGMPPEEIDSAIRVSLSHTNTADDIHRFADGLAKAIQSLATKAPRKEIRP
ncbi:MAG: cysteine desulfurase [Clostridia bacterium]|nr:cysteine desulfurase [Clostridia bacterium]